MTKDDRLNADESLSASLDPYARVVELTDELAAAHTRIAELEGGWQPIETASDEMEFVLLAEGKWVGIGWCSENRGAWYDATVIGDDTCNPTHWRPLPPSP